MVAARRPADDCDRPFHGVAMAQRELMKITDEERITPAGGCISAPRAVSRQQQRDRAGQTARMASSQLPATAAFGAATRWRIFIGRVGQGGRAHVVVRTCRAMGQL